MVTATNATATFVGRSGRMYNIDVYISDVVAAFTTLNPYGAAVATSQKFWVAPEDVVLTDLAIVTGPTTMVGLTPTSNDAPLTKYNLRIANFLNTLTTRTKLAIGWKVGNNVSFLQF